MRRGKARGRASFCTGSDDIHIGFEAVRAEQVGRDSSIPSDQVEAQNQKKSEIVVQEFRRDASIVGEQQRPCVCARESETAPA